MPTATQTSAFTWEEAVRLLCTLPSLTHAERVQAVATLVRSTSPAIRRRALRLGADILPDEMLVAWLRDEADDVLRNAGLEILKLRGGRAFALARQLACDPDGDVVLQAVLLLDHFRDPRGVPVLRGLLDNADLNIVQAAILALGHHRDASAIRDLTPFLESDPWLQIAAVQALGDVGDPAALPFLEPLLADEFLESFASESIAHVGGAKAFRALSTHWLRNQATADAERYLSLLASIMVQLPRRIQLDSGLEDAIVRELWARSATLRLAAATVALASGATSAEKTALHVLAVDDDVSSDLPPCLTQRRDLASLLLNDSGALREWGLQLAAAHPGCATASEVAAAVLRDELPEHLADACSAIAKSACADAADHVLTIFSRVPADRRRDVWPAIVNHGARILDLVPDRDDLPARDGLIISALAGGEAPELAARIAALGESDRAEVVAQILARGDIIRMLPWQSWIDAAPAVFGELLADAVMEANFAEATPLLRNVARTNPSPRVIEALAVLGDDSSIDVLEEILASSDGRTRALACNALGGIGGDRVRSILRRIVPTLPAGDAKFAYRAWASCAGPADLAEFRAVAANPDWLVRAAAAEVLARYPDPASSDALAALALDPVEAVSTKAVAISLH